MSSEKQQMQPRHPKTELKKRARFSHHGRENRFCENSGNLFSAFIGAVCYLAYPAQRLAHRLAVKKINNWDVAVLDKILAMAAIHRSTSRRWPERLIGSIIAMILFLEPGVRLSTESFP
jgi:hypothetical protein